MSSEIIKIHPLGGVGEIGGNAISISGPDYHFLIDSGFLFPRLDHMNLNFQHPDFSKLEKPTDIIITHGHEDHIGAIHRLLDIFPDLTVWATPFTRLLIERKALKKNKKIKWKNYLEEFPIQIGDLIIRPFLVNHSIPETFGIYLSHQSLPLEIIYISDFKMGTPPFIPETAFQLEKNQFSKIRNGIGKRIFFCDSTNILSKNLNTLGEHTLGPNIQKIFEGSKGRIFATFFPSNISRMKLLLELTHKYKKRAVLYGKSMQTYYSVAKELGFIGNLKFIQDPTGIDPEDKDLVILCSGSQGDFKGSVKRITSGQDKYFTLNNSDLFLFSSKTIPGGERRIFGIYNNIIKTGCQLMAEFDDGLHVSGHPGKEDVREMINIINPTDMFPVHGEGPHLKKHYEFIKNEFEEINPHLIFNNDIVSVDQELKINIKKAKEPLETIYVLDNDEVILEAQIKEKLKLSRHGCVFISKNRSNNLKLSMIGLPKRAYELENIIKEKIGAVLIKNRSEEYYLPEIKKIFTRLLKSKPNVFLHLMD